MSTRVPTRNDIALIGPCDGKWCWAYVSQNYPPSSNDLYLLCIAAATTNLIAVKLDAATGTISLGTAGLPACLISSKTQFNSDNVTCILGLYYQLSNIAYVGNIVSDGSISADNITTITLTPQTPSSYSFETIVASVPYKTSFTLQSAEEVNYAAQLSSLQSPYLYFFPGLTYTANLRVPSDDIAWIDQYAQQVLGGDIRFTLPLQMQNLRQSLYGQPAREIGYTEFKAAVMYKDYGVIFYSDSSCGNSVTFKGINGRTQSGVTSVGLCSDNSSSCVIDSQLFVCDSSQSDGNGSSTTDNNTIIYIIIGIAILVVIVVVLLLIVKKTSA